MGKTFSKENMCVCSKPVYVKYFGKTCETCLNIKSNVVQKKIKEIYDKTTRITDEFYTCERCCNIHYKCVNGSASNLVAQIYPALFAGMANGINSIVCCDCLLRIADDLCDCGNPVYTRYFSHKCASCLGISGNEAQRKIKEAYNEITIFVKEFNTCEICNSKFNKEKYGNPIISIYPTLFTGLSQGNNSEICCDCLLLRAEDL